MKGEFCSKCGDGVWDVKSYRRFTKAQARLVTAARNDAGNDIRRIRKLLKLTQTKLAENLGLGKLAFSRYEQGKTQPPIVLVKLMRLIEKHPSLLEELQAIDIPRKSTLTAAIRKQAQN
jgi:HTH-type transcriptional regulator / antitoxin MqsA